jgi:hypothetical protein
MTENNNTYWERLRGYPTELNIDARWLLRINEEDKTYGSLRIVSHPDLKPGYLRAHLQLVKGINPKTKGQILQMVNDYKMKEIELEIYSVDQNYDVETKIIEDTKKNLENIFNVKIFE